MTEIKLPPQNLEAERNVLACQILDSRTVDDVREIISPNDFYADVHAKIQRAILKLRESGSEIDIALVSDQLAATGDFEDIGGVEYLMKVMASVPHHAHAKYYAKIVAKCSRRRKTIAIGQKLMESGYDDTANQDELSEAAIKAAEKLAEDQTTGNLRILSEAVDSLIDDLEKGVKPSVNIMIPCIDVATGGASPGEMFIIGARPSHGKSLFALQSLDCAAANGWPGLIISEEMAVMNLASRSMSSLSVIPSEQWMQETSRLRFDAREHFKDRAKIVVAEKCATASGAERAIETAVRKHGVKIVAVDYAQLLKGTGDNEQERIGDVSQRMKAMAMRHDLIVLLLAQLNRGIETRDDRTPTMADLRGSGSLEQDADVVLFPMWPWMFDNSYQQPREYRIYQAKNRSRGIAEPITIMRINPERQRLEQIAKPHPQQDMPDQF